MAFYIDLFSPDTYEAFTSSDQTISGFRERQKGVASSIKQGDIFLCYVTKLSRWVGCLEVQSDSFMDDTPVFYQENDPFVIRFRVQPLIWLPLEQSIPMYASQSWDHLSFTRGTNPSTNHAWTAMVRGSLRKLEDQDGDYLVNLLRKQAEAPVLFQLTEIDRKKLQVSKVKTQDSKQVTVSIPLNEEESSEAIPEQRTIRDSIKIQAMLAEIGERMNLKIWIPRSDRARVLEIWKPQTKCLMEVLPLNYDDATLKTVENIDVLWIKGRSVVRAFEVEHTTSIYSGILRMADLMALQPNLNINAHIVAPLDRKEKVLEEISRPVFAFLEKGPLAENCSYISYDSVEELSKEKRLEYMTDLVLEEYSEYAAEADF
jgi:hypothetical protein